MNNQKLEVMIELIDEIIKSAICDDEIIKKNDELALTLKEYVNEQI